MIVTFMTYNFPQEVEFSKETTIVELHEFLRDICNSYVITEIRYKKYDS